MHSCAKLNTPSVINSIVSVYSFSLYDGAACDVKVLDSSIALEKALCELDLFSSKLPSLFVISALVAFEPGSFVNGSFATSSSPTIRTNHFYF